MDFFFCFSHFPKQIFFFLSDAQDDAQEERSGVEQGRQMSPQVLTKNGCIFSFAFGAFYFCFCRLFFLFCFFLFFFLGECPQLPEFWYITAIGRQLRGCRKSGTERKRGVATQKLSPRIQSSREAQFKRRGNIF